MTPLAAPPRWPWRFFWLTLYFVANVPFALLIIPHFPYGQDWVTLSAVPDGLERGDLYRMPTEVPFVWSPVAAYLMAGVVAVGYWPWFALHFAAVAALRRPLLIAMILVSWGFWTDVGGGNTFTFVVVAGVFALRGSRWGGIAYLALCLLMPRPVQAPLALWLLWKRPDLRLPFVGMFVVHAVAVLASGLAMEWITTALSYGAGKDTEGGIGLTAFFGRAWLIVGVPLAAWLTWKERVGWAGLAITPYLIPHYLMMPLVEVARQDERRRPIADSNPEVLRATDS